MDRIRKSLCVSLASCIIMALSACGGGGGCGGATFTPIMQFNYMGGGVMVTTFSGTANLAADGTGAAARFQGPNNAVSDGANLYVADSANHIIRKIVISNGAVSTLAGQAGVPGAADGTGPTATFNNPIGITIDSAHLNLYVADTGNNKIRKVMISSGAVTSVTGTPFVAMPSGAADTAPALFNGPRGITTDGTSLYVADSGNNKIRQVDITNGAVSSLTGTTNTASAPGVQDGPSTNATFNNPTGIVIMGASLFVADTGNNKIRELPAMGGTVSSLTGVTNTSAASGALDGTAASAAFAAPAGIGTDGTNLYVADTGNNKIRQIAIGSLTVSSLTGASSVSGIAGFADGAASSATFSAPAGIAFTGNTIFVADAGNDTIRSFSLLTSQASTLAGSPLSDTGANGTGAAARYKLPGAVISDGSNLYVADTGNHTIRKIVISTGAATTLAGQSGVAGAADGTGAAATFNSPAGLATDGTYLYVTDAGNNKIRRVTISSGAVISLTGAASSAIASGVADGFGVNARFNNPSGIATDGANLYVTDTGNNKIRQVTIGTLMVTSLTGASGVAVTAGAADGAASAVSFSAPFGIVIDTGKINLYVADTGNNKIRQVVIATGAASSVTGAAGLTVTPNHTDGAGATASFNGPRGVAADGINLYVADAGNNKIRQVTIASAVVSSVTGATDAAGAAGHADGTPSTATFSGPYGIAVVGASLYVADRGNGVIRRIQ